MVKYSYLMARVICNIIVISALSPLPCMRWQSFSHVLWKMRIESFATAGLRGADVIFLSQYNFYQFLDLQKFPSSRFSFFQQFDNHSSSSVSTKLWLSNISWIRIFSTNNNFLGFESDNFSRFSGKKKKVLYRKRIPSLISVKFLSVINVKMTFFHKC